jgi:hypothetical protein
VRWIAFSFEEKKYSLDHLHPKTVTYVQPAKGINPPRRYRVEVIFSLHCFTRSMENETPDSALLYGDNRETRIFDFGRYELSQNLPAIIEGLMARKCFHTGHGNFFTVSVLDGQGNKIEYEVYFTVSKSTKRRVINLYVQSAYKRDTDHRGNRPAPRPIGFSVILFNTLNKVPIMAPK